MARVVIGLSGGVDSSVAAHLLQEAGHEVIGLFMRNWHDDSVILHDECPWIEDSNDAMAVADKLGIPFQVLDLSEQYKTRIVDYMFAEYSAGRTPNPDVLCNREIKFDIFLDAAMNLGADFVATGHYCRKSEQTLDVETVYSLKSGLDNNKDQSYFLCQLNQFQLSKALFPIGELQKSEVREIAAQLDLVTADKKDSQGLCFIGKVSLPDFLQQKLEAKTGDIIEIPREQSQFDKVVADGDLEGCSEPFEYHSGMGKVVGQHRGAHFFTIGQRKGLMVGGTPEPLFVIDTDVEKNIVYTGQGDNHPGLYRKGLFVKNDEIHWVRPDLALFPGENQAFEVRIRYRQKLQSAELHKVDSGLYIIFDISQKAISPGQFAAWYSGDELIGSGIIS